MKEFGLRLGLSSQCKNIPVQRTNHIALSGKDLFLLVCAFGLLEGAAKLSPKAGIYQRKNFPGAYKVSKWHIYYNLSV